MSGPLKLADLRRQNRPLERELLAAIRRVIRRGDFILGEDVKAFEREFARWLGVRHVVGVDNGTSALELIMRGLGLGPGDEVLVPAMTFVATASAVAAVGARPVLVDVEAPSGTLDVAAALRRVTRRTRAVIPVHLHGYPMDPRGLARLRRSGLEVVEDCCQAHGARSGRYAGSFGTAAAFSFYPSKNLGGLGDGGAVATRSAALAARIRELRNYGQAGRHDHRHLAANRRLDTLQAAALRVKLPRLAGWNAARRRAAAWYRRELAGTGLGLPPDPPRGRHAWYVFAVRTRARARLAAALRRAGVETGMHYPAPIHRLKAFAGLGGRYPVAERLAREWLSLPIFPGMTRAEVRRVAGVVRAARAPARRGR